MASTRLVRKALRNRSKAKKRINLIKRLTSKPVIKNVDIEQIKEEFANMKAKPAAKKETPVKEEPKAEKTVVETPKVEVKAEEKKAPKATTEAKEVKKSEPKAKKEAAPKAEKKEDAAE